MNIEKKTEGTTVELKLSGWLDTLNAPALEETVKGLDGSAMALILDCAELEYISSAGLRQFVSSYKKMNGNMTVRNVSEEIMNVVRLTGLDKKMKFE